MDDAVGVSTSNLYHDDLVSYRSQRGLVNPHTWACTPADEFVMMCAGGAHLTKKAGDTDVTLLDRSHLHAGQIVVSASDIRGQIGVVTGVTTTVDLAQLKDSGEEEAAIEDVVMGVLPSSLRRARPLSLGDYVVYGSWLGRVLEVSLDVDIAFDDGSVCRVTGADSKERPLALTSRYYRSQANARFYPGMRVITGAASAAFFRGSRWLKGHMKLDGEVGTVTRVEMAGVLVRWIASPHYGTDQELVEEYAPPAYQNPGNLTFFCSDTRCYWAVDDKCFLQENSLLAKPSSVGDTPCVSLLNHQDEQTTAALITKKDEEKRSTHRKHQRKQRYYKPSAPLPMMTVSNTHTTVDVLWQDGTRQHDVPSTFLNPFVVMNDDEVFPGQHVIDVTRDDVAGSARRIGVVKSVCSKDHTVNVSWLNQASVTDEANSWKAESDDTVSSYDLDTDPDHCVFYGDVVVRLLPNVSGTTPQVQQPHAQCIKKRVSADLSWVGRVLDLRDGNVQVKWGDGSTSMVLPHEISVANKENYTELQAEMGDWVEEDNADAPQEFGGDNMDTGPPDSIDAANVEGVRVEGGQDDKNELDGSSATRTGRLGGFIQYMIQAVVRVLARGNWYLVNGSVSSASDLSQTTQNAEAPVQVSTGIRKDPSMNGAETDASFSLVTRSDANVHDDDLAHDLKARETNGDEDPSNFPHFDVVQSPPDHHYLDNIEEGCSGGKTWIKAVQKEWKILENSLPDTIYMRAFEDRMDLLRAAMVGASGTPYQDGLFFFDLHLPPSYPEVPPHVYYHSFGLRLNPNLDESGTVCLSLLDTYGGEGTELWSPGTSSLLQVIVSIQALVLNDQPFYNEDGYETLVDKPEGHRNALPYSENAYLLTLRTMLHLLRRPPKGFEVFVSEHFRRRGRYVLRRCEAYLRGCVPAEEGGMELPCSAGFKITLGNSVPRLVAAFSEIGAEGCDQSPLTNAQETIV